MLLANGRNGERRGAVMVSRSLFEAIWYGERGGVAESSKMLLEYGINGVDRGVPPQRKGMGARSISTRTGRRLRPAV